MFSPTHGCLRKYANPINHEQYVRFQFLKLVWNPYNMFKPSFKITFYDKRHIEEFPPRIFSVKTYLLKQTVQGFFFKLELF